jgi:predicted aconitase with swiveling domain
MINSSKSYPAQVLTEGVGSGPALLLDAPISFWGGIDPLSGAIIDVHHPQTGTILAGTVTVLPAIRGSNAGGTVLLECIRQGTSPLAIVLQESNQILSIGSIIGKEIYGISVPIVVLPSGIARSIRNGDHVTVDSSRPAGRVQVTDSG